MSREGRRVDLVERENDLSKSSAARLTIVVQLLRVRLG
jgi:hypothetical protein